MDKILLKLMLAFVKKFVKNGIDFERLKIITETKILMDRRRVHVNYNKQKDKDPKNPLLITLIFYGIFGFFFAIMIFSMKSLQLSMIFFHAYLLVMMAMTLITDFSSVLLDTTDNQIILPRPVNSRTIFMARMIHILVYLLQFTIALALLPLIAVFAVHGVVAGFASILTTFLMVAISVFITYLLYILILKFSNEQKVKDIIGYFQILMTITFTVGFQIVPRLIDFDEIDQSFTLGYYSYFLPPVWMALTVEAFKEWLFDPLHLGMIAAAVTVPILTFWFMIKYLAPSFSKKLGAMQNSDGARKIDTKHKKEKKLLSERLSPLVCKKEVEKAGFEMVWKITGRDKGFKMQFYPGFAYIFVFVFIFVFKSGKDLSSIIQNLPNSNSYLWLIYLPMFTISGSITLIAFYEQFQAGWIYYSTPIKYPGQIISGAIKSLFLKFFVPLYLLMFATAYFVWGNHIVNDFVFGFFANASLFMLTAIFGEQSMPFSRQLNIKMQAGKFVKFFIQLAIVASIVGMHYFALKIDWLIWILIIPAIIATYFMIDKIQKYRWKNITI
jgi:hypothetical protein